MGPHSLARNIRLGTQHHGGICTIDALSRRGSFHPHGFGGPGTRAGVRHSKALQRGGDDRSCAARGGTGHAAASNGARVERRIRLLRTSAHDRAGDSCSRCRFPQLPRGLVACCRAPRRDPRGVRGQCFEADAGPPDHGSDGRPARIHQVVLGLSRYPGQRRAHREWPRGSREASIGFRRGREGLRRRSSRHRVDLGRRIQLQHADRRSVGDPLDCDPRLHRPPPGLFPR